MTMREFYSAIAGNENVTDDLREFAVAEIAKMDARNEKRTSKPSKTAIANEPVKAAIVEIVEGAESAIGAKAVAEAYNEQNPETPITTQKASSLLVQLAKADKVVRSEDAKKNVVYTAAE